MSDPLHAELVRLGREQLKMLRFLALREIRRSIEENVKTDQHKLVYENSTGKSMREVGKLSGVSHAAVGALWEKWAPLGIVTETDQPGRYERLCGLREVGLDVPPMPKNSETKEKKDDSGGKDDEAA